MEYTDIIISCYLGHIFSCRDGLQFASCQTLLGISSHERQSNDNIRSNRRLSSKGAILPHLHIRSLLSLPFAVTDPETCAQMTYE